MAKEFRLQDPGEGIHEAEIQEIRVEPGDEVSEGDIVLLIETDKAAVEIPSPYSGTVEDIPIETSQVVRVGDILMTFADGAGAEKKAPEEAETAEKGREYSGENREEPEESREEKKTEAAEPKEPEAPKTRPTEPERGEEGDEERKEPRQGPIPASPATRRVAKELGVDLSDIEPSGDEGRVLVGDVRAHAEQRSRPKRAAEPEAARERPAEAPRAVPPLPDFAKWGEVMREPLRSIRRATAHHMALSWSQIPHVTHHDRVDITELERFRQRHEDQIKEKGGKLTLTAFALKAAAAALAAFPRFGASLDWEAQEIILKQYCHIGVALETDRGLYVPVVRDVDRKSVTELAVELHELSRRVRDEGASREELAGGTFTITNVGGLGGTGFTPIINYPQVAILGMAEAALRPVVDGTLDDHRIVARLMLPICVAFDHRVIDGAEAARFTRWIATTLADPEQFALMV